MVDVTLYGTVYNSVKYINRSLRSLAETVLRLQRMGISANIVIVDNYSNDGTWERMIELKHYYAKKGVEIKLIRYKCSRGLGRNIALHMAEGKYVFFVDLDLEYVPDSLAKLIAHYIIDATLHNKSLYIFLMPKEMAINAGGFYDLNRTEDIEFGGKIIKQYIMLPVLDENYKPIPFSKIMRSIEILSKPQFFISTFASEIRYSRNFTDYLKREMRNKIDMICGMGYTPSKIVLEALFMRRLPWIRLIIWVFYHLFFYILARLKLKKISNYHKYVNNGSLCDVAMFLNYIALTVNLIKSRKDTNVNEFLHHIKELLRKRGKIIAYFLLFEPKSLKLALQEQYFTLKETV